MTILMRVTAVALLLAAAGTGLAAGATDEKLAQVAGNWLTEPKDGIIQITVAADGKLEGRIVGGNHPGLKDLKNSDPARRDQALRGQVILRDMKYDGDGKWSGGTVYKPQNGKTYSAEVTLLSTGVLKVRGYVGISLFGISQNWTRYSGTSMDLPPAR